MFCSKCGQQIDDGSKFCLSCGAKVEDESAVQSTAYVAEEATSYSAPAEDYSGYTGSYTAAKTEEAPAKKFTLYGVIRSSVLLVLAALLVTFAFFPFIRIEDGETVELSAINVVTLLVDSFEDYDLTDPDDVEDFAKLDIWDEIKDLEKELAKEEAKAEKSRDIRKIEELEKEIAFLYLRTTYMTTDHSTNGQILFAAIAAIIYLIVAVALGVIVIFNLIASFGILKGREKLGKYAMGLFTASAAALTLLYFTVFTLMQNVAVHNLTATAVATLSIVLFGVIAAAIARAILEKNSYKIKYVPRVVAIVLSALVICCAFGPVISAGLTATFDSYSYPTDGDSTYSSESDYDDDANILHADVGINVGQLSQFTHLEDLDELDDIYDDLEDIYGDISSDFLSPQILSELRALASKGKEHVESDAGENENFDIVMSLVTNSGDLNDLTALYGYAFIPMLIVIVGALLVIWQNLYAIGNGKYSEKTVKVGKLVAGITAAVSSIYFLIISLILTALAANITDSYTFGPGLGIVFFIIFAIGGMFCPHGIEFYDRAPVNSSYYYNFSVASDEVPEAY
jgi:hypothetical protein